jgi:hypothetical protein
MCLFYKRLDRGVFRVLGRLEPDARHIEIDEATFEALLDGVIVERKNFKSRKPMLH